MVASQLRHLKIARKPRDILVSYLGKVGKSGAHYARLYAEQNGVFEDFIVDRSLLREKLERSDDVRCIVFVDDFIGTGRSAIGYLSEVARDCGEVIKKKDVLVMLVVISGFRSAQQRVVDHLDSVNLKVIIRICDSLSDSDKCFHEHSHVFATEQEKARARRVALSFGLLLEGRHPLGFGECEALVVFDSNTPNNSLPILWKKSSTWSPIFRRV